MTATQFESVTILRTIETLALALAPKGVTLSRSTDRVYLDCEGRALHKILISVRDEVLSKALAQFPGRTLDQSRNMGQACWFWGQGQGLRVGISLTLTEAEQFEILAGRGQDLI